MQFGMNFSYAIFFQNGIAKMQRHLPFFPVLKKSFQMTPHFINSLFIMYMSRILRPTHSYLFQSCKSTLQILDDIVDMLSTDGKTDGVLLNALIGQLLVGQLGVGCCCWMDNQALYICYVC